MNITTISTHNGTFHIDEVTAYAMLNYIFPQNTLIRTRDPHIINQTHIAIDVGQIYDPSTGRFDHHQSSFKETFDNKTAVILSSAGLIYKHYGKLLIDKFCKERQFPISDMDKAYTDIYYRFIVEIDAHDNGIRQYSDNFYESLNSGEIKQKFYTNLAIGQVISKFNTIDISDETEQLNAFKKASNFIWEALSIVICNYFQTQNELQSEYKIMENALNERLNYSSTGEIVVIKEDCNSWRKCIAMYENEHEKETKVKFIVYPSNNKAWNVRAISDLLFTNRRNLLPLEQIKQYLNKPEEVIFVHNKLFIASATTLETAIQIAIVSLKDN